MIIDILDIDENVSSNNVRVVGDATSSAKFYSNIKSINRGEGTTTIS